MSLALPVSARFDGPTEIPWKLTEDLTCPLYQAGNGVLLAPTSGTITIYDSGRVKVVDGAAVSITGSVATYTSTGFSDKTPEDNWEVEWTLVVSGETRVYRNDALLVRRSLALVLTDLDLYDYLPTLDPSSSDPLTGNDNYVKERRGAGRTLRALLRRKGVRVDLVCSPHELMDVHLHLTMTVIYRAAATSLNSELYSAEAAKERQLAQEALDSLLLRMDTGNTGNPDAELQPPAEGVILAAPDKPRRFYGRGRYRDPRTNRYT